MKRRNSNTGVYFTRGDVREDEFVFFAYRKTQKNKNGYFKETWLSKENFEKRHSKFNSRGEKRLNPKTGNLFVKGNIREDGWKFITYNQSRIKNDGYFEEVWVHPDKLDKSKIVKRIDPKTGITIKKGTKREDGRTFSGYDLIGVGEENYAKENWVTDGQYTREHIVQCLSKTRKKSKKLKIPHNVSIDYAHSIFPKDFICPVLGIKMEWGNEDLDTSPSFDRIIPQKGYVEGNVCWISYRANKIKSDADSGEIFKVYNWLKNYDP